MDKHALRRRNRLLKKNEARMNLLLGKSEEGNVEKDTEDKKKAPDLKPKQSEINQEEGHDEGEKKQPPHTGKDQVETQINSLGQASTADADLHTEDNSKQKGDASSVHEQTQEGKEKEKNDPTGQEEQKGDPEKGPKGGQRGELTNRAKKKRISNHPGDNSDNERDDYTNADDINNPSESNSAKSEEGKINEGAPIATPQFKVSIFRLAQFVSLIFIASIVSIVKIKYCDYNPLPMSIEPMRKKKKLQRFISSKFVFFFLSLFYNTTFSLIDVYAHYVKQNMSQKEIWRNLQNLRERLTSQSESLLYLLNNGTTLASFFVSIVKTYLLLMFLTHLFDDLLYNYTVRKTWASAPLPAS
ncbi:conserved Plasmodium protein, unknown function [Plasmodium knowlesi strain H]|uniref:Uncharacterized protein n=3 Tax=Plasmodium knowlesi TaxID=5850 RepID=A0A5K1UG22_PLAKH|nr:conserved Plasmodium protein, unknown function [Plasmodium knowlesi strain H]OTN66692.1 Uncharacterized protein PKNOH_S08503800 [Plasmodium knowlesi]CAA9986693.1 conserved Plasmodium protein, unknown function [Plasmodium knowlesi strain H]SBO23506.1 conserved Plasmodium protein, unknown function [Plasmodium knowlesi strain H]SBO24993.1 conserved Plasmodium protein, unknown function [Plasmodium knowlesi strain H]VVS76167.1 conserved Plasmodium protein, unknown function [Plasmodium knowlesi s|eukprot:XP_002257878.1 hypothetical protein, conserved in Plasmodium species [Plasmodium knowlesi strain H]